MPRELRQQALFYHALKIAIFRRPAALAQMQDFAISRLPNPSSRGTNGWKDAISLTHAASRITEGSKRVTVLHEEP